MSPPQRFVALRHRFRERVSEGEREMKIEKQRKGERKKKKKRDRERENCVDRRNYPPGVDFFHTVVRRRKYKLGQTKHSGYRRICFV